MPISKAHVSGLCRLCKIKTHKTKLLYDINRFDNKVVTVLFHPYKLKKFFYEMVHVIGTVGYYLQVFAEVLVQFLSCHNLGKRSMDKGKRSFDFVYYAGEKSHLFIEGLFLSEHFPLGLLLFFLLHCSGIEQCKQQRRAYQNNEDRQYYSQSRPPETGFHSYLNIRMRAVSPSVCINHFEL